MTIIEEYCYLCTDQKNTTMTNNESARELILQILRTRMAFRQTLQRVLKRHNVDMTFEMLQVMNCLWNEQGISQQSLSRWQKELHSHCDYMSPGDFERLYQQATSELLAG